MTVQDVLNLKLEDVKNATVVTLPKYKRFESNSHFFRSFYRAVPTEGIMEDLNSMGFPIKIENTDDLWLYSYSGKSVKGIGYFHFFYDVEFEGGVRMRLEATCIPGSLNCKWGGWYFGVFKKNSISEDIILEYRKSSDYFTK